MVWHGAARWVGGILLVLGAVVGGGCASAERETADERMEPKVADLENRVLKAAPASGEFRVYASIAPTASNVLTASRTVEVKVVGEVDVTGGGP